MIFPDIFKLIWTNQKINYRDNFLRFIVLKTRFTNFLRSLDPQIIFKNQFKKKFWKFINDPTHGGIGKFPFDKISVKWDVSQVAKVMYNVRKLISYIGYNYTFGFYKRHATEADQIFITKSSYTWISYSTSYNKTNILKFLLEK